MIEIPIYSLGSPPAFSVPTSQADYWLQRICHEASVDRYNANTAGITQKVATSSDISTLNTALSGDIQDYLDWLDDFATDKTTEFVENLIDLGPLITAIASGGSTEVLPLLIGHIINILINGSQSRDKGARDNSEEIADAEVGPLLDNMHLEINIDPKKGDEDGLWSIYTP